MNDDFDQLLPAIAAGDAHAFGRFMAAVELPVRRSLRPFALKVDVEAVVQEAFLRLWQVAPRFERDGRDNGLLRLVLRISRNLALDELKRRREVCGTDLEVVDDRAVAPEEIDPMLRRLIAECFERLPNQPSTALRARLESEGADPDVVLAERCGMKPNTFFQNVTRARKLLGDCLDSKGVRFGQHAVSR